MITQLFKYTKNQPVVFPSGNSGLNVARIIQLDGSKLFHFLTTSYVYFFLNKLKQFISFKEKCAFFSSVITTLNNFSLCIYLLFLFLNS